MTESRISDTADGIPRDQSAAIQSTPLPENPFPPEVDEYEEESGPSSRKSSRRRLKMFCFHCNRPEGHFLAFKGTWLYSFFVGMSFGLVKIFGPYKCQCCGKNRMMAGNFIHPKFHWKEYRNRALAGSSGRSSSRRRSSSKKKR